ncbi:DUF3304 domain-containing protein [Pseudomonas sp. Au-Pse12]|uniref:DUF3304 domain-containing protein n=1 Tax=Pseudomonas sp. Au-Pse12 TaxID=2906459 RepID=UPI001E5BBD0C|nr:DUF3304 domain-containing protein [Pseudomonas sp. Au-Pse12]MCE4053049.1 DUF3304 domain-containing protein [Pseudomonas sp. Au-Pse12]
MDVQRLAQGKAQRRIGLLARVLVSALALQGCAGQTADIIGLPIEGFSHTSAAINRFSVNGNGGPNISPYGGGGSQMCCAALPVKWYPGLTVVVEWEKDSDPHASANWPPLGTDGYRAAYKIHAAKYTRHRAVVAVAPYDRPGAVNVHFLPCNQVKVSAGLMLPGTPTYPYRFPQKMQEPKTCPPP